MSSTEGTPCGGGEAHQGRVRVDRDARRERAAEGDHVGVAEQAAEVGDEGRPLPRRHRRARLPEAGRGNVVGDRDRAPGLAGDRRERGRHRVGGQQRGDPAAGRAAQQAGREDRLAERVQHARHVEPLAAGPLGHRGDPVGAVPDQLADPVGQVERGVEGHRDDHEDQQAL
nr:hypothetical protein GCM10020092_041910 [Actinoplanes digitatis]